MLVQTVPANTLTVAFGVAPVAVSWPPAGGRLPGGR